MWTEGEEPQEARNFGSLCAVKKKSSEQMGFG
jgi:hypothetical protein